MLDFRRERLQDDLRGLVKGEVLCDTVCTQLFATDASIYEIPPLGVVSPKNTADVIAVIHYAREHGIPIYTRGAGSGTCGGALGEGIVLNISRFMRRIQTLQNNILKVQAGVQCSWLNEILKPHGFMLGSCLEVNPAATVGGLLSVDGYGSYWLSAGRPSDWLLGMDVVTATGEAVSFSCNEPIPEQDAPKNEKNRLLRGTAEILQRNESLLQRTAQHRAIHKMDYRLNVLRDDMLDMARLIAGSEGTLGVITSVTLQLQRRPKLRKSAMLLFESMEKATRAIAEIMKQHPDACDLIDRRYLHLATEQDMRFDVMFPENTEVAMLLDFSAETVFELMERMRRLNDTFVHQMELAFTMIPAWDEVESQWFWSLVRRLPRAVKGTAENLGRVTYVEDVAVPPPMLREFILKVQELLRQNRLTSAIHAHAAQGQVRLLPMLDLSNSEDVQRLLAFTQRCYQLVFDMGGSIGAERGIGFGRASWLPFFTGERYQVSREIKTLFDPDAILQPGRLGDEIQKSEENSGESEELGLSAIPFLRSEFTLVDSQLTKTAESRDAERSAAWKADAEQSALGSGWGTPDEPIGGSKVESPSGSTRGASVGSSAGNARGASVGPSFGSARGASVAPSPERASGSNESAVSEQSPGAYSGNDAPMSENPLVAKSQTVAEETGPVARSAGDSVPDSGKLPTQSPAQPPAPSVPPKTLVERDPANVLDFDFPPSDSPEDSNIRVMEQVREILGEFFEDVSDEEVANLARKDAELRMAEEQPMQSLTEMGLRWETEQLREVTSQCDNCAVCCGMDKRQRSCPIFRLGHDEASSPRAKVNLLNGFLSNSLELNDVGNDAFYEVARQCFQCHACRVDCPSQVDVPFLVRRAMEIWSRARGLNFYESARVRKEKWIKRHYHFPAIANLLIRSNWGRWLIEKAFDIAHQRELPLVERYSFLAQRKHQHHETVHEMPFFAEQEPSDEIRGKVVYFLDSWANYYDAQLAEATVRTFEHNGIPVLVPPQEGSGLSAVMLGRRDYVEMQVERNAAMLADYIRQGYDVVLTEPSTLLAFRHEYPQTFRQNEDIQLVARRSYDAGEYLYHLHLLGQLKLPQRTLPIRLAYHAPCRLRALNIGLPFVHLLRLIPGVEVEVSPVGCCGMGGAYGMSREHYHDSIRIGRRLHVWLRNPTLQVGTSECSSCQMQMAHKSTKPILPPMKILASAYSLLPELDDLLMFSEPQC